MLEPVKPLIDAILRADVGAPRKQRPTIDRIVQRLAGEHDFELAAYSLVRDHAVRRRPDAEGGFTRTQETFWAAAKKAGDRKAPGC
ncbi:hypothetical protein [Peterkaempfera griseoplana]|uniref:hypothetical protein n=1 Tax=Peterkaempfera griseoplana TaxID=66896 RepID=UPI0006E2BE09|nr:hypothetical protein [Peterkaempfera griseoplana]